MCFSVRWHEIASNQALSINHKAEFKDIKVPDFGVNKYLWHILLENVYAKPPPILIIEFSSLR